MKNEDKKKQLPLRLSQVLYNQLASWAQDDFRSINGQIEYLLSEAVKKRGRNTYQHSVFGIDDSVHKDISSDSSNESVNSEPN